jgi:hypothetical protein
VVGVSSLGEVNLASSLGPQDLATAYADSVDVTAKLSSQVQRSISAKRE